MKKYTKIKLLLILICLIIFPMILTSDINEIENNIYQNKTLLCEILMVDFIDEGIAVNIEFLSKEDQTLSINTNEMYVLQEDQEYNCLGTDFNYKSLNLEPNRSFNGTFIIDDGWIYTEPFDLILPIQNLSINAKFNNVIVPEDMMYDLKISSNLARIGFIFKTESSSKGDIAQASAKGDELGKETKEDDKHEKFLFNVVRKYNRNPETRTAQQLNLEQLINYLKQYLSYYGEESTSYKIKVMLSLYLIDSINNSDNIDKTISEIKKYINECEILETWSYFYKNIYYFVRGWLSYLNGDYASVKNEYEEFLDFYSLLIEDAKINFLEGYRVFVLYALGDVKIQLSEEPLDNIPNEWKEILIKYPKSEYAEIVNRIIERSGL